MTISIVQYVARCSGKHCEASWASKPLPTPTLAQEAARAAGWTILGIDEWCPVCWAKREKGE